MAVEYTRAPDEVVELAEEIIGEHHEHLADLEIAYLFRTPTPKRGGVVVLGSASKASAKVRALAGGNIKFVIELAADEWDELTDEQKRALVDHELCHCCRVEDDEGEIMFSIRGHDVEEFQEIVERHGAWTDSLGDFSRQLEMFAEPRLKAVGG